MSNAYEYPLLIRHLLHTPLALAPQQVIVSGSRRYDYRGFYRRLARLANALAALGVGRGDTVAVMDWDSHRYLECFFAVPMLGAVLHTINVRLSPQQILYTINHAEDDVILVQRDFVPLVQGFAAQLEPRVKFVLLQDAADNPADSLPANYAAEYEALLAAASAEFDFADFDENTIATTFYTTGTTGEPKGVYYTQRQLVLHTLGVLAGVSTSASSSRLHRGDVYMPLTPMFHVHAWGFPYVATALGLKQVYPRRYAAAKVLALIEAEGVTFSHCVPTILHNLLHAPPADTTDLSAWKVLVGGAALPQGLAKAALQRGVNVWAAYGLSETCPFLSVAEVPSAASTSAANVAARCKAGKPVPLVELRVVDAAMNDAPRDGKTSGEVVARAPWLTGGYVKARRASQALWQGGYLHSGDVGYLDADGALQLTDRSKDVIKSGGEWISSLQLEDIASGCDGVAEVAAIGIADARWGERPMLLVVAAAAVPTEPIAAAIRAAMLQQVARGRIVKWGVPARIEFVEHLDKTSVGKLDKKALRARYTKGGV